MTGHHDPATHGSGEHTLGGWLRDTARRHPHKVAVDDRGVPTTYAELEERSEELARAFRRAGYGAGDRVATLTGNSVDHVVVFFACAKAGLTLVPLSWRLTVAELAANLAVARPALVLAEEERLLTAREALARAGISAPLTELGGNGVETTAPARHLSVGEAWPEQRPVRDDDGLLVIFTSGSEARPKGVVLTHANCFWNNLALARALELSSRDVVLSVLLQFHVAGWNCQPLAAWWLGATVVLEHNFVPSRVLQLIPARGVTTMMGVPTQYHLLAGEPRFADADLSTLRHVLVGGSTMPAPVLRAWQARDVDVIQGYGS